MIYQYQKHQKHQGRTLGSNTPLPEGRAILLIGFPLKNEFSRGRLMPVFAFGMVPLDDDGYGGDDCDACKKSRLFFSFYATARERGYSKPQWMFKHELDIVEIKKLLQFGNPTIFGNLASVFRYLAIW